MKMRFDEVVSKRVSVREFSSKKVRWSDILEAIDAAGKAPFAGNINNIKFIIVENRELKNRIAELSQQSWIAAAGFVVVVCSDESKLEKMYDKRGLAYSRQQAGAAIENFLLKIVDMGLSACWVGAYSDELIKQALKMPENINIEAVIPIGHARARPRKTKKAALENLIYWDFWDVKKKPFTKKEFFKGA